MGIDKKFLDRQITAADPEDSKSSVRFATTVALAAYNRVGNVITMTGNGAMPDQDGVTPVAGDDLLVNSDGSASDVDNGIYTVTQLGDGGNPTILTRRGDADANDLVTSGMNVWVTEGLTYAAVQWILVTADPFTLNTDPVEFAPVETGGGGFTITEVAAGDTQTIPDKRSMVFVDDVEVEAGGNLIVEGDLQSASDPENHTIAYVGLRQTRVIHTNEVMNYDELIIDGNLIIDGDLDPLISTGQDVLDALTDIAPGAGGILGAASPARFLTDAETRTFIDVYTTTETDAVATAAAAAASGWLDGLTPVVEVASFTGVVGALHSPNTGPGTMTLPAGVTDGETVGLVAAYSTWSVQTTAPNTLLRVGDNTPVAPATPTQISDSFTIATVYFVFNAGAGAWAMVGDRVDAIVGQADKFLGTDASGRVVALPAPSPVLLWDGALRFVSWTALPNRAYRYSSNNNLLTVTLPAAPTDGDEVLLVEAYEGAVTVSNQTFRVNGNGRTVMYPGQTGAGFIGDMTLKAAKNSSFKFKYSSSSNRWHCAMGTVDFLLSQFAVGNRFIFSNDIGQVDDLVLGDRAIIAKAGTGDAASFGFGADSFLARAGSGNLSAVAVSANQLVGRQATNALGGISAPSTTKSQGGSVMAASIAGVLSWTLGGNARAIFEAYTEQKEHNAGSGTLNDYLPMANAAQWREAWWVDLNPSGALIITGIDTTDRDLDGFLNIRRFWNTSAFTITLKHLDVGSLANNRFDTPGAADFIVGPGEGWEQVYDRSTDGGDKWRITGGLRFTAAEQTKLGGIETSATADQTGAEIASAYEGETGIKGAKQTLTMECEDILGASAKTYRLVLPACTIVKLWSVIDAALATGTAILTASIDAVAITGGVITIDGAAVAGEVDSATPSALNVATAGQVLKLVVSGTNTGAARADVTVEIEI